MVLMGIVGEWLMMFWKVGGCRYVILSWDLIHVMNGSRSKRNSDKYHHSFMAASSRLAPGVFMQFRGSERSWEPRIKECTERNSYQWEFE